MQGFWDTVDRHGLDRNSYRTGFLQLVAIADTDAEAEAEYAAYADYFYNRRLHSFEGFAEWSCATSATCRKTAPSRIPSCSPQTSCQSYRPCGAAGMTRGGRSPHRFWRSNRQYLASVWRR
jgi:hypothetical protein